MKDSLWHWKLFSCESKAFSGRCSTGRLLNQSHDFRPDFVGTCPCVGGESGSL